MSHAGRAALVVAFLLVLVPSGVRSSPARNAADRLAEILGDIPVESVPTGILYDRVVPLSRIEEHDGAENSKPTDLRQWRQLYDEIRRASIATPSWPDLPSIIARGEEMSGPASVPIVVMDFRYDRIRPSALEDGSLVVRGSQLEMGSGNPFVAGRIFAAAPLRDHTYRGSRVRFRMDTAAFFGNDPMARLSTMIDFDDGRGFVPVSPGIGVDVRYLEKGRKQIRLRSLFADGATREAGFPFEVRELLAPSPNDTLHVTATIPYLGGYGAGDAYVYLSGQHAALTKPVRRDRGVRSGQHDELGRALRAPQPGAAGGGAAEPRFRRGGAQLRRRRRLHPAQRLRRGRTDRRGARGHRSREHHGAGRREHGRPGGALRARLHGDARASPTRCATSSPSTRRRPARTSRSGSSTGSGSSPISRPTRRRSSPRSTPRPRGSCSSITTPIRPAAGGRPIRCGRP